MKLYNKTKCPNNILRPLLVAAGKSVSARTGNVVVKITQGYYAHSRRGHAVECWGVQTWHLKGRRRKGRPYKQGYIDTDGGWFQISLPGQVVCSFYKGQPQWIIYAESFYETAQHEWSHIKDFQNNRRFNTPRTTSGRRVAWRDRPVEISAENHVAEAKKISNLDDMILELALYFENRGTLPLK